MAREISKEQILYYLINFREQEAKKTIYKDIVVNKDLCKEIGIFSYQLKESGKQKTSRLFLINETQDGENVNIIYDENGKLIGIQNEQKREQNEIEIAKDIEINTQQLARQIGLNKEKENQDTQKAGDGRDLASREHEEKPKEETKETNKDKEKDEENIQLSNLREDVYIEDQPKIKLDEVINGYYLWEILQIEDKLKGKMPEGLSESEFRTGYLTIVDSKKLNEKDGKERKSQDTFVITTRSGDVIELDEQVLKPKELGSFSERMQSEKNRLRYEDGKEAETPDTQYELTRTSMYQIPNASEKFGVSENWFLAVDNNREYMLEGKRPENGYYKNISFVQVSRNESQYEYDQRPQKTLEYKLEPFDENLPKSKKEIQKEHELRAKGTDEAATVRNDHIKELVDRCFVKHPELRRILQ